MHQQRLCTTQSLRAWKGGKWIPFGFFKGHLRTGTHHYAHISPYHKWSGHTHPQTGSNSTMYLEDGNMQGLLTTMIYIQLVNNLTLSYSSGQIYFPFLQRRQSKNHPCPSPKVKVTLYDWAFVPVGSIPVDSINSRSNGFGGGEHKKFQKFEFAVGRPVSWVCVNEVICSQRLPHLPPFTNPQVFL